VVIGESSMRRRERSYGIVIGAVLGALLTGLLLPYLVASSGSE
jgi:uncharacterized membrane protein YccC